MNACMHARMHARTHAWTHTHTHTHTHTGRRSGGQEGADGARETGKGHASYTADIHNTGGCVCVCVYVCVCVCDSEIFTGCQARREVARGRSCLFGTLSGAGLNNCIRIGCVHECSVWERVYSQNYTQVSAKFSRSSRKESSRKMSDISTGEMATDPGKEKKVRVICVTDRKIFRLTLRPSRTGRALT